MSGEITTNSTQRVRRGPITKRTEQRVQAICDRLRLGVARTPAVIDSGVSYDSFKRWYDRYPEFRERVLKAEASAIVNHTMNLTEAANGIATGYTDTMTKTVFKERTRKITHPDGTVEEITESVPYEEKTVTVRKGQIKDWKASLEWLKRRNPADWRENVDITTDGQPINTVFVAGLEKVYGDQLTPPSEVHLPDSPVGADGELREGGA